MVDIGVRLMCIEFADFFALSSYLSCDHIPGIAFLTWLYVRINQKKKFASDSECGTEVAAFVHSEDRRWPDPIVVFIYCHSSAC